MKKFVFLFLFLSSIVYADKDIPIKCYNGVTGEYLQTYKASHLQALMSNSEKLLFQEALEKNNQIYIKLSDDIYKFKNGTYEGYMYIIWGEKEVYKKLTIKTTLQIEKEKSNWFLKIDKTYGTFCKIVFPIMIIVFCFII